MQLTAPSLSLEPQAGQVVGGAAGCGRRGGGGGGAGLLGAAAGRLAAAPAPATRAGAGAAAAGAGAGAAGATKAFLQKGQRNCLPPELSASCICWRQCGQLITYGMF